MDCVGEPTLEPLLGQVPIRDSMFEALGDTGVFLLRYVLRGIERPKVSPLVVFVIEGDLKMVEWAFKQYKLAAKQPPNAKHDNYVNSFNNACMIAATRGRLDILKVMLPQEPRKVTYAAANTAARAGHFEIVKWMHKSSRIKHRLPLGAKNSGNNANKFVHFVGEFGRCDEKYHACCKCTLLSEMLMANIASTGDLSALRWFFHRGYNELTRARYTAAEYGHIHLLEWIRTAEDELDISIQHHVRSVHVLDYLHDLELVDRDAFGSAASKGLTELMDWLHSRGFRPRASALKKALEAGQKSAVEWLISHGATWAENSAAHAAQHSLDMLLWAMERGAPWTPNACIAASEHGNDDVVKYALKHKLPFHHAECVRIRTKRLAKLADQK